MTRNKYCSKGIAIPMPRNVVVRGNNPPCSYSHPRRDIMLGSNPNDGRRARAAHSLTTQTLGDPVTHVSFSSSRIKPISWHLVHFSLTCSHVYLYKALLDNRCTNAIEGS
jgi:hypothetical protein